MVICRIVAYNQLHLFHEAVGYNFDWYSFFRCEVKSWEWVFELALALARWQVCESCFQAWMLFFFFNGGDLIMRVQHGRKGGWKRICCLMLQSWTLVCVRLFRLWKRNVSDTVCTCLHVTGFIECKYSTYLFPTSSKQESMVTVDGFCRPVDRRALRERDLPSVVLFFKKAVIFFFF